MDSWSPLDATRLVKRARAGFLVIKPNDSPDPVPLFCQVCGFPNLTHDDVISHKEYSCCSQCNLRWVDINRQEWSEGWRPSREDVGQEISRRLARGFRVLS